MRKELSEDLILENEQGEQFTLKQLLVPRDNTAAHVGRHIISGLKAGATCEELAADIKRWAESPEGLAKIGTAPIQASEAAQ